MQNNNQNPIFSKNNKKKFKIIFFAEHFFTFVLSFSLIIKSWVNNSEIAKFDNWMDNETGNCKEANGCGTNWFFDVGVMNTIVVLNMVYSMLCINQRFKDYHDENNSKVRYLIFCRIFDCRCEKNIKRGG